MANQWIQARQTKYVAYATVYVLVVIAVVVIANMLADRYNKVYDGTANKRYSLSEQTAKIVKGLPQAATITYYDQTTRFRNAQDVLDQYANLSPKIHVEYVDPDKKPQVAREAGVTSYGVTTVQIGAKKEQAKGLTEEGITGAIIRDLKNSTRTVCFVTGSGEHQIDNSGREGYSRFKELLAKDEYETKSISLLETGNVPADCTALVVAGPTREYQQVQVEALKKYIEAGGRGLFLLDPPLKMGKSEIADNDALSNLLSGWGVTPGKDLVLDLNPIGQLAGLGPQVALVTSYAPHQIVEEMKGTATGFPLSRSLEFKNTGSSTAQKLFESSERSLATTTLNSPQINPNDPKNKKGPLTLAVAGKYKTGKENSEGRFVVVGGSTWASNSFITFNGNGDLATNTINWLASDEDLISIRPKDKEDRRLTMTRGQMTLVRATSQFLLPLLVVIAGAMVWWKRR